MNYVFDIFVSSCRWLPELIISRVGWPGIAAAIAAVVLVLAASPKALKAVSSPRGMVAVTTVLLGALTFICWEWGGNAPVSDQAVASSEPAAGKPEPVEEEAPKPEPEPELEPALAEAEKPATTRPASIWQDLPPIPMTGGYASSAPPLYIPPPGMVKLPPSIIANPLHGKQQQGETDGHTGSKPSGSHLAAEGATVRSGKASHAGGESSTPIQSAAKGGAKTTAKRAGNAGQPGVGTQPLAGRETKASGSGGTEQRPLTRAEIRHQQNEQARHDIDAAIAGGLPDFGGGMHPGNTGMHQGNTHPGGTAGHTGTHHPAGHPR